MVKMQLKVITQIKTRGDALGKIWPQVGAYLVHILAKHWAFIAYIKHISALQTFGHSQLKQILPSSAIF